MPVALSPIVAVAPLQDSDRSRIWTRFRRVGYDSFEHLVRLGIAHAEIVARARAGPADGVPMEALNELHSAGMDTLRLLGDGDVHLLWHWVQASDFDPFLSRMKVYLAGLASDAQLVLVQASLDLDPVAGEAQPLYELLRTVSAIPEKQRREFQLARRRFNLSYERGPEDALVDCWIALEALYSGDGEGGDLAYRLKMRLAASLENEAGARAQLGQAMQRSYGARSKVVHGSDKGASLAEKHLPETRRVLRRALRAWLEPGAPRTLEELDALLLDNSDGSAAASEAAT
jgi:hypothetical protein